MSTIKTVNQKGSPAGDFAINPAWIESDKGSQAVHESVVAFLASLRGGTASTKTRADVSGSGTKPWKQKGTGNARIGSKRSPVWRGGGVAFGPKPRTFHKDLPKKVRALAVRRALSERLAAGELIVVEELSFTTPKTKDAAAFLKVIGASNRPTLILDDSFENFEKTMPTIHAFQNIGGINIVGALSANAYDVLSGQKIVITKAALQLLGERIAKEA